MPNEYSGRSQGIAIRGGRGNSSRLDWSSLIRGVESVSARPVRVAEPITEPFILDWSDWGGYNTNRLGLRAGQRATAKANGSHHFKDGTFIEFVEMDRDYYVFRGFMLDRVDNQRLRTKDFEVIDNK